jgi:DNA adenine methylase
MSHEVMAASEEIGIYRLTREWSTYQWLCARHVETRKADRWIVERTGSCEHFCDDCQREANAASEGIHPHPNTGIGARSPVRRSPSGTSGRARGRKDDMKRTSSEFPEAPAPVAPPRYNVELPGLQTYVSGLVTNNGRAARARARRGGGNLTARPFLKWTGGKRQLLPELLKRVPASFGAYHEPFVGGGALFFALAPMFAHLGDMNPRLVTTYRTVQSNVERLIERLAELALDHDEEAFYARRASEPTTEISLAAWMIYLNKTCFNGLWRVNRAGRFNAPFGRHDNPTICDADNLRVCSAVLHDRVLIRHEGFEAVADRAKRGDLVYFDPPYVPVSATSNFTGYTSGGFGSADQERLRDVALALKRRGVHVLLSNSGTPAVADLYAGDFEVSEVAARRLINSKASNRGAVVEYVIT